MKLLRSQLVMLFAVATMVSLAGCGPEALNDQPKTGTVTGTVTMDDKPMANVHVVFEPVKDGGKSRGRSATAVTDDKGHYELRFNASTMGAKIGRNIVRITTPSDAPGIGGGDPKEPIPSKYNKRSEFKVEVKEGENDIPIELFK